MKPRVGQVWQYSSLGTIDEITIDEIIDITEHFITVKELNSGNTYKWLPCAFDAHISIKYKYLPDHPSNKVFETPLYKAINGVEDE
jgi:hypothetical protein